MCSMGSLLTFIIISGWGNIHLKPIMSLMPLFMKKT